MHFEKTCSKAKFFCGEVRAGAVARLALRFRKNISRASGGSLFCAASRAGARLRFRFSNSPAPAPARLRARVSYFQPAARACATNGCVLSGTPGDTTSPAAPVRSSVAGSKGHRQRPPPSRSFASTDAQRSSKRFCCTSHVSWQSKYFSVEYSTRASAQFFYLLWMIRLAE